MIGWVISIGVAEFDISKSATPMLIAAQLCNLAFLSPCDFTLCMSNN